LPPHPPPPPFFWPQLIYFLFYYSHRTGAIAMRHQHHTARSISITANNMFNTYT
jgi:hypothetical protein